MFKKYFIRLMIVAGFILTPAALDAQEFPIAVGDDSTFGGSAAFDGTNYLVGIMGDTLGQYNITAQLVSPGGSLVGNRISVGSTGTFGGAAAAFDGSNYLLIWKENNGNVNGQFINPSGNLVGTLFTIATNVSCEYPGMCGLSFSDSTYLVVFVKVDNYLYGQRVSKSGNLIGGQIQISSNYAREISLAYDGINYLVAWVEQIPSSDKDIYGQFVSKTGSLVGSNFLIDGGPYLSDNPTSLAFDGTRYLLAFHETPDTNTKWTLFARFITTSGTIEETIVLCDSTKNPFLPVVAFGNNRYLATWTQFVNLSVMGRFYNTSGVPIDTPFVIFDTLNNKIPLGGCMFGGNKFLAGATRIDSNWTDGDVYGRFIQPLGIEDENNLKHENFVLCQNYPNPFNSSTNFSFKLSSPSFVSLKIFNVMGREITAIVSEQLPAGTYDRQWHASGFASGVYFCRLQAGAFTETKALLLLR